MAKEREVKTNAMRILDRKKIPYHINTYECEEFIDGIHIADQLGLPYESSFKTLVLKGRSGQFYVFVLPIAEELDLKTCARTVGEKSVEMVPVRDILSVTGYVRGGCSPLGMKKQYKTVIQETAQRYSEIVISGGRLGVQILLAPEDLQRACSAEFADIVQKSDF